MLGERKPTSQNKKKSNEPFDKKEKKIDIPKEFIKKIKKLGMREDDAEILFQSKIDWTAVYSENKIYCPEVTCDYFTKIDSGDLRDHLISVHQWGDYPCQYANCDYKGVSKVRMHSLRSLFLRLIPLLRNCMVDLNETLRVYVFHPKLLHRQLFDFRFRPKTGSGLFF